MRSTKTPGPGSSKLMMKPAVILSALALILLGAGCAKLRPYRMGGIVLETQKLYKAPEDRTLSKLPATRPLVVAMFGWRVSNPVGLKINLDGAKGITPIEGMYYGRGVHVTLFEAVFDALAARRRWVYRDYLGMSQPGATPAWARQQRFLVLEGEIMRFEHSHIRPDGGVKPPRSSTPHSGWGHEAAYVKIRLRLRDSVSGAYLFDKILTTYTKWIHTSNPLAYRPYRSLGTQLVELLRADPAFYAALGGGR